MVHYVDKTESLSICHIFLKIAVLSPILSTKGLSTTALVFFSVTENVPSNLRSRKPYNNSF